MKCRICGRENAKLERRSTAYSDGVCSMCTECHETEKDDIEYWQRIYNLELRAIS